MGGLSPTSIPPSSASPCADSLRRIGERVGFAAGGADYHADQGGWQEADFYHRSGRKGPDPLFSRVFVLATSVNFLPAALGWENLPELTILAVLHLLFINRVRLGRAFAATENAEKAARANHGDTETRRSVGTEEDADAEEIS